MATDTAGAIGWHGLATAGVLQTFVAEVNSSLVNTDMGNVVTMLMKMKKKEKKTMKELKHSSSST